MTLQFLSLSKQQVKYFLSKSILLSFLILWLFSPSQSVFAETIKQESNLQVVGRGPVVPMSDHQSIPISTTNVKWIDVDILKSNDPTGLLSDYYFNQNLDRWDLGNLSQSFTSVFLDRFTINHYQENKQIASRIKLPSDLQPGWYIVVLKPAGNYQGSKQQIRHILLTDITMQAKVYQNSIHIRAANLHDGKVLTHGVAKLYRAGRLVETQRLDNVGQATFTTMPKSQDESIENDVIYLESDQQISYLALKEIPLDLSEFSIGGQQHQNTNAFVYSNRDLVRPGETLPVQILLADGDGKSLPSQPLSIRLVNSKNAVVFNKRIQPEHAGSYQQDIKTQVSWPVGRYTLEIRTNPNSQHIIEHFRFQIEEFTPERMDLITTPTTENPIAGENLVYQLTGKYLFGTPANGNTLKTDVSYQTTQHFPGKYNQYFVGQRFALSESYKELAEMQLGEEGTGKINIPTPANEDLKSPVSINTNFSLLESSGAAVQRQQRQIIWRGKPVPALLPYVSTFTYASQAIFDIALLNANGDDTTKGEIEITFEHDQGRFYWVYEEGDGWTRHEQARWKTIETKLIDVNDISQVQFPVDWGDYRITLKDTETNIKTQYEFYAGWYEGNQQIKAKPDQIAINLDKPHYKNGDTINANIEVPADGDITISVESDQQLWSNTFSIKKGQQTITIPVDKEWNRHDLYITSLLTSQINGQPKRYFGITPLTLDREDRKLALRVELPENLRPLTKVSIPVHVDQAASDQDTWVTLSMVDKGIINLSRFKPKNPFDFFYSQRRYQADVIDLYSRLYDLRPDPFATSRFGSDLVKQTANKNNDLAEIKTITWMSKAVKVVDGIANFTVAIPDYNGEAQVIATAFNKQQYGQQVLDKVIADTTIVELGSPKFFAPGDESSVAVDITNKSESSQIYTLSLSASNASIKFMGDTRMTFNLAENEHVSYRFPLQVAGKFNHLNNTFTLHINNDESTTEKIALQREWQIPIRPVVPIISHKKEVSLSPNETYTVSPKLWNELYWMADNPGYLIASYSPLIDVNAQVNSLFNYPYGCSEQVTSTASPFLYQSPLVEIAKQKELTRKNHTTVDALDVAVQKLAQRQLESGGFSLWDGGKNEEYWVTIYATEFLLNVQKSAPTLISDALIDNALERVTEYVRSPNIIEDQTNYKGESQAILAYAAFLASSNGKLTWSEVDNINSHTTPWPSKLAKLQMAVSYANVGSAEDSNKLLNSLPQQTRYTHYLGDYGSELRDNAIAVTLLNNLIEVKAFSSQAQRLKAEALHNVRNELANASWLSTQENNAVVQAGLIAYADNQEQVSLQSNNKTISKKGMISLTATPQQTITNTNDKNLLLDILTQGYPDDISKVKSTIAASVSRKEIFYADGRKYQGGPLNMGERLVVRIKVQSEQTISDALLVDLIPAGFSLENPNLNQGPDIHSLLPKSFTISESEHVEYRSDRFVVSTQLSEQNSVQYAYILRAEAPGKYHVPAAQLESMYRPELRLIMIPNIGKITVQEPNNTSSNITNAATKNNITNAQSTKTQSEDNPTHLLNQLEVKLQSLFN
ncbi:alpha-2-macroglobulin family protein [Psychromonas sp. PT13]|uniref:alpha-2-macroglobulin family protein n=1 Tax=Psychromonas sp. PT13 TaxID=3439547 RepID=UPI003EBE2D76